MTATISQREVIAQLRSQLAKQATTIADLIQRNNELQAQLQKSVDHPYEYQGPKPTWRDAKKLFDAGHMTWTEAFDALMSQCGLPMEEALITLAEHFDRRPAITIGEPTP